jgi:tetratricopeptide (TPR) repeat protein
MGEFMVTVAARGFIALVAVAGCWSLTASPAVAQRSPEWEACTKTQSAPDPGIVACTKIIRSGKEKGRNLAIAYNNRGDAYWAKDDNDNAFADYDRAIKIDVNYATAYVNRAIIWRRKKNDDAALADLNKALQIDPQDGYAYNNRGNIWHTKGDLDRALADYEQALRINDKMATRHANRGNIFRDKGDLSRAQTDYSNALRLDPNFPAARTGLGLVYEKQGDTARARTEFQTALDLPAKYDSSDWAKSTARERLAALGSAPIAKIEPPRPPRPDPDPGLITRNEKRVALVIGNSGYKFVPALPNPRRDAEAIASSLRRVGFSSVVVKYDLSREQSMEALKAFAAEADRADWAVVYFAGHGLEMGGTNYLVPVDAQLIVDRNVSFEALPLDQVLASVNGARKLRLVILDACRDNPFLKTMTRSLGSTRSVGRGLATIEPEGATLVAYAAKHGNVAEDGADGNSPFVTALTKYVEQPGLEINLLFRKVRDEVLASTGRRQEPYIYGSLPSEAFYFKDR